MAITRAQVLEAVEKYLPRTANFSKSGDLGEGNPDAVYDRIKQILLTSLLVDDDAVFYLIYLASRRLVSDLATVTSLIDSLQSTDQLKGLTGAAPSRIDDYSQLEDANTQLVRLSSGVVTNGVFGDLALSDFQSSVEGFLTSEIKPNVEGGNRDRISRDIRSTMASLKTSWADVLTRRAQVFGLLDKYVDEDIRTQVSAIIISAIRLTIQDLLETLPELSTQAQAEQAEQIMVDLAAAEASLTIIGNAGDPEGTLVDSGDNGSTRSEYLEVEGEGLLEPIAAIRTGSDGRLRLQGPAAGGATYVGLTGQTIAGAGTFTTLFTDPGVADFVADGITVDMYLTFVDTGTTHRISVVATSQLTLEPSVKHRAATPQRYAIINQPVGKFFRSDAAAFWITPGTGTTDSTSVAAGTAGSFVRVDKANAADGIAYLSGFATSQLDSVSTDFYLSGVQVGDLVFIDGEGEFQIVVVSQHGVTLSGLLSVSTIVGATFAVYSDPGTYSDRFVQTDGDDFVALEVEATLDVAEVTDGENVVTPYPTVLTVDGVGYRVRARDSGNPTGTLRIFALAEGLAGFTSSTQFEDPSGSFAAVDAAKHVLVSIAGTNAGSTWDIASVVNDTTLQITGTASLSTDDTYQVWPKVGVALAWNVGYGPLSRHFTVATGATPFSASSVGWEVVWRPGTVSEYRAKVNTYVSAGEVWLSAGIPQGETQEYAYVSDMAGGQTLVAAGRSYVIEAIVNETTLQVSPFLSNSFGQNVEYQVMRSADAQFVSRIVDVAGATSYDAINGFSTALKGARVDLNMARPVTTTFSRPFDPGSDGFAEGFQVGTSFPVGRRKVAYRITSSEENASSGLLVDTVAGLAAGDRVTIWTDDIVHTVASAVNEGGGTTITVQPPMAARLSSIDYVVVRGGGLSHGSYLLVDSKNSQVVLDADTDSLRLHVAEVLLDYGTALVAVSSGVAGAVTEDGDVDGVSPNFSDAAASFLANAKFGDRLSVEVPGGDTAVVYVSRVVSDTKLRVEPELVEGTGMNWSLDRSSVSASLVESERLRVQITSLLSAVQEYVVAPNSAVLGAIGMLESQRLDRAIDLLYEGKVDEFINLGRLESSYATYARSSIQSIGASTSASPRTQANVAGKNPATSAAGTSKGFTTAGAAATAGTSSALTQGQLDAAPARGVSPLSSSASAATGYASEALPEGVEVRVALAQAVNDLADDELLRSISFASFEEVRNRAIYELSGTVESGVITDTDATLPWIAQSGSIRDRVDSRYQDARNAIQYMIDNPDQFDETGEST